MKIYANYKDKSVALFVVGEEKLAKVCILLVHI